MSIVPVKTSGYGSIVVADAPNFSVNWYASFSVPRHIHVFRTKKLATEYAKKNHKHGLTMVDWFDPAMRLLDLSREAQITDHRGDGA